MKFKLKMRDKDLHSPAASNLLRDVQNSLTKHVLFGVFFAKNPPENVVHFLRFLWAWSFRNEGWCFRTWSVAEKPLVSSIVQSWAERRVWPTCDKSRVCLHFRTHSAGYVTRVQSIIHGWERLYLEQKKWTGKPSEIESVQKETC